MLSSIDSLKNKTSTTNSQAEIPKPSITSNPKIPSKKAQNPKILKNLLSIIDMHLLWISKLPWILPLTAPIILKIPSAPEPTSFIPACTGKNIRRLLNIGILKGLLDEVKSNNKIEVLKQGKGSLMVVKFTPKFQQSLHLFIAEVKDEEIGDDEREQVLTHLAIVKQVLETMYAM